MSLFDDLKKLKEEGKIFLNSHPTKPLWIANYTPQVQFKGEWSELLMMCRGLVVDENGNIIARPFKKFFNLHEHLNNPDKLPPIPKTKKFDVYEKLDGSLIILFWYDGEWEVASRGSFISEHAKKAREMIENKYGFYINRFDKSKTHLFELIAPEFRIVVNYGDMEELFLLAIIETKSGKEDGIFGVNFPNKPKIYDGVADIKELFEKYPYTGNQEGFVIRFRNGFRLKLKYEEYVKLHRMVTGLNENAIYEMLKSGEGVVELKKQLPEEFYGWIDEKAGKLLDMFEKIKNSHIDVFKNEIDGRFTNRKEMALKILSYKPQLNPSILFALADDKNIDEIIWKMIKPKNNEKVWGV